MPVGLRALGTRPRTRTGICPLLRRLPLPLGQTGVAPPEGIEPPWSRVETGRLIRSATAAKLAPLDSNQDPRGSEPRRLPLPQEPSVKR